MPRTLSPAESRVVLELQWREQVAVTLDDIQEILGGDRPQAWSVAHRLARKGWLERLTRGHYRLIPADRGVEGVPDLDPYRVEDVIQGPHFFSYATACKHHGFTDQVFPRYYVAVPRQRPKLALAGVEVVFVQVQEEHLFGWETVEIYRRPVPMADPPRALLDALDRPRYAGGIGEVSLMVRSAARRLDWDRLLEYLERLGTAALAQRLGYLLDLHEAPVPPRVRRKLLAYVTPGRKLLLASRERWGTRGSAHPDWNVVENVPRGHLVERSKEGGRRR